MPKSSFVQMSFMKWSYNIVNISILYKKNHWKKYDTSFISDIALQSWLAKFKQGLIWNIMCRLYYRADLTTPSWAIDTANTPSCLHILPVHKAFPAPVKNNSIITKIRPNSKMKYNKSLIKDWFIDLVLKHTFRTTVLKVTVSIHWWRKPEWPERSTELW